jgi:predicted CxxxxCH...CXXCH cytochrome family protein
MRLRSLLLGPAMLAAGIAACETSRESVAVTPYTGPVEGLLSAQCVRCHAGPAPAGGWRASSYLDAIGCTASGAVATARAGSGRAPIVAALDRPDHAGLASASDRAALERWVEGGSSRSGGGVHPAGFADPRSPDAHGAFLRRARWAPMTRADDADACGACHDGAPARDPAITGAAAGAPACTTCHAEPGGALACGTCHGDGARPYPPRDRCFFPGDGDDRAHAAHAGRGPSRTGGLPCSSCHPVPAAGKLDGAHGDGQAEVWFDHSVAGREARFDPGSKRCTGTCHARGGARPQPAWTDARMGCNDCHGSPPPDHYRGACTSCHREANADGTALGDPVLHVDGKVDLGDGSGRCGACHGSGDDPWPATGAHRAHAAPAAADPVACASCHEVPRPGERHPVGRGGASVRFAALAVRGGRRASYDPVTRTCAGTYCHEGRGAAAPAPRWTDGGAATACSSCHGTPPPPPHVQTSACSGSTCHAPATGAPLHVNGAIDRP